MKYRFSPEARADLEEAWLYTASEWGIEQADRYAAGIAARIDSVLELPNTGSPLTGVAMGYRKIRSGQHLAIYRVTGEELIVVRVLHEREDLPDGIEEL